MLLVPLAPLTSDEPFLPVDPALPWPAPGCPALRADFATANFRRLYPDVSIRNYRSRLIDDTTHASVREGRQALVAKLGLSG